MNINNITFSSNLCEAISVYIVHYYFKERKTNTHFNGVCANKQNKNASEQQRSITRVEFPPPLIFYVLCETIVNQILKQYPITI